MSQPDTLWNAHSRQWRLIGSPLRPGPQDIARYGQVLADWQGGRAAADAARAPSVLLLGVTPEIASLSWPGGASLVAADHSCPMIDRLWRGQTFSEISAGAVCADWKRLPLADASRDIAIGDGCFSAVDFPGSYRALIASLNRVLRPEGLFVIRLFLRPDRPEAVEAVFALLEAGRIGNFHAFKWRLAQALHGDLANGVELDAIWRTWRAFVPAPEALAEKLGWPMEVLATIDAYRGSAVRYTFPTLDEMRASLAAAFTETGCFFPDYELGERCPILALRPVHAGSGRKAVGAAAGDQRPGPAHDKDFLLGLIDQLEASQWLTPAQVRDQAFRHAQPLLRHAYDTVPYYRGQFDAAGIIPGAPLTAETWAAIPLLSRADVQSAANDLDSVNVPKLHGQTSQTQTSGSTGEPVKVRLTEWNQAIWNAVTLRNLRWHDTDLSARLASIRALGPGVADPPDGQIRGDWGRPAALFHATGPGALLSIATDVGAQAAWLLQFSPDYLATHPSNLMSLLEHFARSGTRLSNLRKVHTFGEMLTPAIVTACRKIFGVAIVDVYSSNELGNIALQCPESGLYHVQSESVLVEVLDARGAPCQPGEIGRVVVTSLHNYATPLLRYVIGDYAEVGPPCPCGRGLPTLKRIVGRVRNMLCLPSGEKRWPLVGFAKFRDIAPIRQYQFVQKSLEEIEARFVADRPLTPAEEAKLTAPIQASLGHPFPISFRYPPELRPGPNGKFEEFISAIAN